MNNEMDVSCAEVQEIMPWLLNGTLHPEEAARAQDHIATCTICAEVWKEEMNLATALQTLSDTDVRQAVVWDRISDELNRTESGRDGARILAFSPLAKRLAARGPWLAAAAVALLAVVLVPLSLPRQAGEFETLTTPEVRSETGVTEVRVLPAQPELADEVMALMNAAGARDIAGPSEAGLLRGFVNSTEAVSIAARLKDDPRVALAVTDVAP